MHVAQRTEEEWPLCIKGNDGRLHNVTVQPGQTILYESARLVHGRPFPLIGDEFVNAFIHFKPLSWNGADVRICTLRSKQQLMPSVIDASDDDMIFLRLGL